MMADISIRGNLELKFEMPWNEHTLVFQTSSSDELTLYPDLEQWWALRVVVPKAKNYFLSPSSNEKNVTDHDLADKMASEFYWNKRTEQAEKRAAKTEGRAEVATDETCQRCDGTGVLGTPYSGSDPSCPDCSGEGVIHG